MLLCPPPCRYVPRRPAQSDSGDRFCCALRGAWPAKSCSNHCCCNHWCHDPASALARAPALMPVPLPLSFSTAEDLAGLPASTPFGLIIYYIYKYITLHGGMDRLLPCLIVGIFAGLSVPTIQPNAWAGSPGQPGPLGLLRAAAPPCSGTPPLRTPPPPPPPVLHHLLPPES